MNQNQNVMISASQYNIIYVDIQKAGEASERNIGKLNKVSLIKALIFDEEAKSFHVMTNMFND